MVDCGSIWNFRTYTAPTRCERDGIRIKAEGAINFPKYKPSVPISTLSPLTFHVISLGLPLVMENLLRSPKRTFSSTPIEIGPDSMSNVNLTSGSV